MKGGVVHTKSYNSIENAIDFFLKHSTLKLLTNTSISCVTFVATLDPDIESSLIPLISSRDNTYACPVNTLLIKVFPLISNKLYYQLVKYSVTKILPDDLTDDLIKGIYIDKENRISKRIKRGDMNPDQYGNPQTRNKIEITKVKKFEKEFDIQQDIYNKTYDPKSVSKYDAICPRPIHKEIKPIGEIYEVIESLQKKEDLDEIKRLFIEVTGNNVHQVGLIYMEMMDGWNIVYDVLYKNPDISDERKQFFKNMFRYEIDRLHSIGYAHLDSHHENAMVNLQYPYLTSDTRSDFIGRVILIDFGRSKKISDESDKQKERYIKNDIKILEDFTIKYSGFILDKTANYENINRLRINFNKKRNKERKIDPRLEFYINKQIIPEPPGWLQRTSLAISRIPSFFTRKMMPLYQTQQHLCPNQQPLPEIVAEQTSERTPQTPLAEIVLDKMAQTPQTLPAEPVLNQTMNYAKNYEMAQKPQYSARTQRHSARTQTKKDETSLSQMAQTSVRTPRPSARTQQPSARTTQTTKQALHIAQYIGGRQRNRYSRVNTRKKRRRQKMPAKNNSISRRSTRKKR